MKVIATGIEDFKEIIDSNYYYVDKTKLINDVLTEKVVLFTRPRRFGKTLNMSMLYYFFSIKQSENAYLFDGLEISKKPEIKKYQNKYPVIFITFKEMKQNNFLDQISTFKSIISKVAIANREILESNELMDSEKDTFKQYINRNMSLATLKEALLNISEFLKKHYHQKVIVIIDEYDVPMQCAYLNGYYDEMSDFLGGVLSAVLKTNNALEKGIMTGCLRIAKESIFTGLNNFSVCSITDKQSASCFGFTPKEIDDLVAYYNLNTYRDKIKEWYDGYLFGDNEIYNPWSVLKYLKDIQFGSDAPKSYWANTSSNDIVKRYIEQASTRLKEDFDILSNNGTVEKKIKPEMTYREMDDLNNIYSFLLYTGYLKIASTVDASKNIYHLALPNEEVKSIYTEIFDEWFDTIVDHASNDFYQALISENIDEALEVLSNVLYNSISYYDYDEKFYHGLVAGILSDYRPSSNQESGLGRYDIAVLPLILSKRGIVIEIKCSSCLENLEKDAHKAVQQINDKEYITGLKKKGYKDIIGYGIAFYQKYCSICKIGDS